MGAKIISFVDVRDKLLQDAYSWAIKEQERLGCVVEPIKLLFESDCLDHDEDGCVISVFRDGTTGKTLLRKDWLDEMAIQYSILTNFDEIELLAPNSANQMIRNGLKIYKYFDGPAGGITRKIPKPLSI